MAFITSILALALAASNVMADDVYSTFYAAEGQIAPNFDVSNSGCFSIDSPIQVSFDQHANGPYCLSAWDQGGCPGAATAKQTFGSLNAGTKYALSQAVASEGSYSWSAAGAC